MANEQLLSYIRQNTQAGFSRQDIETTLHNAGWADAEILAAFETIAQAKNITSANTRKTPPVSELQRSTDSEVARIQEELRIDQLTRRTPGTTNETGIIGFIIRTNMASDKRGAKILLGVVGAIALALIYIIFLR